MPFSPIFAIARALITEVKERYRQTKFGVLIGAVVGALAGIALSLLWGSKLAEYSFDLSFQFRRPATEAVIVFMDDVSHTRLQQDPLQPWSRKLHADLVERLTKAGASLIVFDVLFSESSPPPPGTAELAAAMKKSKVVLASVETASTDSQLLSQTIELPARELLGAATGVGVSTLEAPDRTCRRMFTGSPEAPSLAWVAAQAAGADLTKNPLNMTKERWLNFYGPAGAIPNVSYATAMSDEFRNEFFAGKTVFIGSKPDAGFTGLKLDEFKTSYTLFGGQWTPGVEIHATAFLNLLRDEALYRLPSALRWLLLVFGGMICGGGFVMLKPGAAAITTIITALAITVAGVSLPWKTFHWFNWAALVVVQVPLAFIWSITYNSIKLHIEKLLVEQSLRLHLSPRRAQQIMGNRELLKPGAEKLEIAIMFTDIANFSKITGRMEPGDLFGMMNNYFQVALTCVHQTDGTVIKLIGDAIFAVWNAPFPQEDFCTRAARAALALQESVLKLEQDQKFLPLRTRIGLHCGEAYVGNVGSTERLDYTAMGDNINMTSRLEGLNKIVGTQILASRAFQKNLSADIPTRLIGHFRFKGIDRVVQIHELLDAATRSTMTDSSRRNFEEGLFHLQRKQFNEAEAAFTRASYENPQDGPAKFYLMMIPRLRQKGVHQREDWEGEIELDEK